MSTIVHDTAVVIRNIQMLYVIPGVLIEVVLHPGLDLVPIDSDEVIAIESALLVPEADDVHQLVLTDAHVNAPDSQRHQLHPAAHADLRSTSIARIDVNEVVVRGSFRLEANACLISVSFHCSSQDCPISERVLSGQDIGDPAIGP